MYIRNFFLMYGKHLMRNFSPFWQSVFVCILISGFYCLGRIINPGSFKKREQGLQGRGEKVRYLPNRSRSQIQIFSRLRNVSQWISGQELMSYTRWTNKRIGLEQKLFAVHCTQYSRNSHISVTHVLIRNKWVHLTRYIYVHISSGGQSYSYSVTKLHN
jgi:hypothetical protein